MSFCRPGRAACRRSPRSTSAPRSTPSSPTSARARRAVRPAPPSGRGGALHSPPPRGEAARRRLYIHQTLAFLACTGLASAFIVSPLNPWMPGTLVPLAKYGALVPAFVALWVTSALLDFLPTIEERIPLQAYANISLALARAALVAGGAWATGGMGGILWLLLATGPLKPALLFAS